MLRYTGPEVGDGPRVGGVRGHALQPGHRQLRRPGSGPRSGGIRGGALLEVWSGSTFDAQGSKSQIASVEFTDRDGDGNLEILRRGRLVDCGDDCLCRDGPLLERFEAVYGWDEESGRFVERPEVGSDLSPASQ